MPKCVVCALAVTMFDFNFYGQYALCRDDRGCMYRRGITARHSTPWAPLRAYPQPSGPWHA